MANKKKPNKKNGKNKILYTILMIVLIAVLCASYYFIFAKQINKKEVL